MFWGSQVSDLTTQLYLHSAKESQATGKWKWLCSNKSLFINTDGRPDLAHELEFANAYFIGTYILKYKKRSRK